MCATSQKEIIDNPKKIVRNKHGIFRKDLLSANTSTSNQLNMQTVTNLEVWESRNSKYDQYQDLITYYHQQHLTKTPLLIR